MVLRPDLRKRPAGKWRWPASAHCFDKWKSGLGIARVGSTGDIFQGQSREPLESLSELTSSTLPVALQRITSARPISVPCRLEIRETSALWFLSLIITFRFQMVMAIGVLRLHLLELEKVRYFLKIRKTFISRCTNYVEALQTGTYSVWKRRCQLKSLSTIVTRRLCRVTLTSSQ